MPNILDSSRARLGPPPRALAPEDVRDLRLTWWPFPLGPPPLIDPLFGGYLEQGKLRERGEVVWGYLLQANQALFSPGFEPQAATVLYGEPELEDLDVLAEVASVLYSLKGTRQKDPELKAAVALTHETNRKLRRPVPRRVAGDHTIYCSDLMIHRGHLPGERGKQYLRSMYLPLLANPLEAKTVMVLPARFWPEELLDLWAAD